MVTNAMIIDTPDDLSNQNSLSASVQRTDTHPEKTSEKHNRPIDAFIISGNDYGGLFNIYLEFVLYWIRSDIESYRNTFMMVTGYEEKEILLEMVSRKTEMFDAFKAYRSEDGHKDWFESTLRENKQKSTSDYMLDNDSEPIQNLIDAIQYVYQRESQTLGIFEKVNQSNLEKEIHALLENAIERQRRHILYLDSRLSGITQFSEPVVKKFTSESTGVQWALISRSK